MSAGVATMLHAREQGDGAATVLMLHSSAGSSGQWRALTSKLHGSAARLLAVDLHGHGRSPGWPDGERDSLAVDAAAAWRCVGLAAREVHLVGHSYGAAVALQMALMQPSRVRRESARQKPRPAPGRVAVPGKARARPRGRPTQRACNAARRRESPRP